jgi:NitT/TauT family transport system substrate-binding protein
VSDAYKTKTRIDPKAIWDPSFLPSDAQLDVLPKK